MRKDSQQKSRTQYSAVFVFIVIINVSTTTTTGTGKAASNTAYCQRPGKEKQESRPRPLIHHRPWEISHSPVRNFFRVRVGIS